MIVAAMMVLGLGTGAISNLVAADAPGASVSFGAFSFSGLGLAAIVGILLNLLINWKSFKKS